MHILIEVSFSWSYSPFLTPTKILVKFLWLGKYFLWHRLEICKFYQFIWNNFQDADVLRENGWQQTSFPAELTNYHKYRTPQIFSKLTFLLSQLFPVGHHGYSITPISISYLDVPTPWIVLHPVQLLLLIHLGVLNLTLSLILG